MKWITLLAFLWCAATVSAQAPSSNPWDRCTTLHAFGGAAVASPGTTASLGGAIGWEFTERAELEGTAAWFAHHSGTEGFAADLKLLFNLMRPAVFVPYIGGGGGLYSGTFDVTGGASSNLPPFYQRRMGTTSLPSQVTYIDPTAVIAVGAQIYVARHFSIRPDMTLRFVRNDGRAYRVTTASVGLVYHVEQHIAAAHRR